MTDNRITKFAQILVDYSTQVKPGDVVTIATTSTASEPLVRELFTLVLDRGGHPNILMDVMDYEELLLNHARDEQLESAPLLHKAAFEQSDVLIKVRAATNTRALTHLPVQRKAARQKGLGQLVATQMKRGASGDLRWMSTIFPTSAYAMEAEMATEDYQDFFFRACHATPDTPDPVAHWLSVRDEQQSYLERLQGHDQIEIRGPAVELVLSVKGRKFNNSCGIHNLPDGEVYTGPVEESINGWVRYSYPSIYQGNLVQGVELNFKDGKVIKATADKNQDFLSLMLETDPGARYVGEFAIGLNYQIDRFTGDILLDEKIGGSFHTALGAGYPETGSLNKSAIHWDMICDLRQDSEILVDGEVAYRNGRFIP